MKDVLSLTIFGCSVRVWCKDAHTKALLTANYGYMQGRTVGMPDLHYAVGRKKWPRSFFINREGGGSLAASDESDFLFLFEKDMTIQMQRLRRDLYFVHAAVLESAGRAFLLVAPSGGGKSTITWGLLHHGFGYLSDELGPVDLKKLEVYPYPHAVCLKDEPPRSYPLPAKTVRTSRTLHIPVEELPGKAISGPLPLERVFFLRYDPAISQPKLQPVSKAQATARIVGSTLNLLAHPGEGVNGAIEIAETCSCFELITGDLQQTCGLFQTSVNKPEQKSRGEGLRRVMNAGGYL